MSRFVFMFCAALLLIPRAGQAAQGVRPAPDGTAIFVNKDVGTERWAIALNTDEDSFATGNVSGNVFRTDGGNPAFIWCEWTDGDVEDLANTTFTWDCFGASQCVSAEGCIDDFDEWADLGEVTLSGRFFLP